MDDAKVLPKEWTCQTGHFHLRLASVLIVLFLLVIGIPAARMTVGGKGHMPNSYWGEIWRYRGFPATS